MGGSLFHHAWPGRGGERDEGGVVWVGGWERREGGKAGRGVREGGVR